MSIVTVLKKFKKDGFVNPKRAVRQCGGNKRKFFGNADIEKELLSHKMLQKMAPLGIARRKDYIWQKYGVECSLWQLRHFYKKNNLTYRIAYRTWKISEAELAALNEQRREFAVKLRAIKAANEPIVYFDEVRISSAFQVPAVRKLF